MLKNKQSKVDVEYSKVEKELMEKAAKREAEKFQKKIAEYESKLYGSSEFMKVVLFEAISKLENKVPIMKVEQWVSNLEKDWNSI